MNYDIVIVGASTAGSYYARRMAERGFSVLVIDRSARETISPDYDIFHMGKADMERFGLPEVKKGDGIFAFMFEDQNMYSAFGNHPKPSCSPVIGMHKHDYIVYMNDWAIEAGAEIIYKASFSGLLFDEKGRINGVEYEKDGEKVAVNCRLVCDCSGIPAVVRTNLPDNYGVEKFELTPDDMFYVILRYIDFKEKRSDWLHSDFWLMYKSWIAPSGMTDALIGIGSCSGFEQAEKMYELFTKNVKIPAHTVKWTEKGRTPYHRAPYSFVADGFIAMGDAACLTKPTCGEGCTSSLVQAEIAVDVISALLKENLPLSKENMWSINKRYMIAQGKDFDFMRPLLMGVVTLDYDEAQYMFENEIIFSEALFSGMDGDELKLKPADVTKWLAGIAKGVAKKKIRAAAVGNVVKGLVQALEVGVLYDKYPETPHGFSEWKAKADKLWDEIGSLADTCFPDILESLGLD